MTTRRLRAAAVLGATVLALAACQDASSGPDPAPWPDDSVAAYVGEAGITEAEVDSVVKDLRAEIGGEIENELAELAEDMDTEALAEREKERYGQLEEQLALTRTRVLEMRILTEVASAYVAREGLEQPEIPDTAVEQQAHELKLPVDSAYAAVVTEFKGTLAVLQPVAESVAPTEDDQREVYDHLVEEGLTTTTFAQARAALTKEIIGAPVAMRNLLAEAVAQAEVRVNPQYDLVYRVPVPVGSGESWLALPLGEPA